MLKQKQTDNILSLNKKQTYYTKSTKQRITNCCILTIDNTIIIWYNINDEQIAIDDSSRQITR